MSGDMLQGSTHRLAAAIHSQYATMAEALDKGLGTPGLAPRLGTVTASGRTTTSTELDDVPHLTTAGQAGILEGDSVAALLQNLACLRRLEKPFQQPEQMHTQKQEQQAREQKLQSWHGGMFPPGALPTGDRSLHNGQKEALHAACNKPLQISELGGVDMPGSAELTLVTPPQPAPLPLRQTDTAQKEEPTATTANTRRCDAQPPTDNSSRSGSDARTESSCDNGNCKSDSAPIVLTEGQLVILLRQQSKFTALEQENKTLRLQLQGCAASIAAAASREAAAAHQQAAATARERATAKALEGAWSDLMILRQELAERDEAASALTGLSDSENLKKRHCGGR